MNSLYFNFQTALLILLFCCGVLTLINWEFWMLSGIVQLVLGALQYSLCCIMILNNEASKPFNVYWVGSSLLIISIILTYHLEIKELHFMILLVGMPWFPAVYFWYLSKLYREGSL